MATDHHEPVACTLTTKDASRQFLEWEVLRERATSVTPIAAGVRMVFPATLVDNVRDLAAREATCCSFLSLEIALDPSDVTLDISSANPDGRPMISALTGAEPGLLL